MNNREIHQWRLAALLKDRTRRDIRRRVRAGERALLVAEDFGVPIEFVEAIASWQIFEDDAPVTGDGLEETEYAAREHFGPAAGNGTVCAVLGLGPAGATRLIAAEASLLALQQQMGDLVSIWRYNALKREQSGPTAMRHCADELAAHLTGGPA